MIEFVNSIFIEFAWETGILGSIKEYIDYWDILLIIFGILFCFLGLKVYRGFFSLFTFMATAIGFSYLMKGISDWGTIVTSFSVIGITLGFLAYTWNYLGACIINVLITLGLTSVISNSFIGGIIPSILVIISTVILPVITTQIFTSIFGGILLGEVLGLESSLVILLVSSGIVIQWITNKRQNIFEKKYPDKINHLIEKRRKERES